MNREVARSEGWDEQAIKRRGAELFGLALALWPRPDVPVPDTTATPSGRKTSTGTAPRHMLRWRFWQQLLERANGMGVMIHANRAPSEDSWLSAGGTGRSGFSWTYLIWMDDKSGVELYFGNSDADVNKRAFDLLAAQKSKIEEAFGSALEWERLDGKQGARIKKTYHAGGLNSPESEWPHIQEEMIEGMRRLYNAAEPFLGNQGAANT